VARTVNAAFETFLSNTVELTKTETDKARTSRDFLIEQLMAARSSSTSTLPLNGQWQPFGSFARRTKVRPLDDVDLLIHLNADSAQIRNGWFQVNSSANQRLMPGNGFGAFKNFIDSDGDINSTMVLNEIKRILDRVPNYQQSEIKRNQVAVTLNLSSYPWIFDIVPALAVSNGIGQIDHYLIPNGSGNWMPTDPRRDQTNVTRLNQQHGGMYLRLVRLLKYWNVHCSRVPLASYHLETLIMKAFDGQTAMQSYSEALGHFFTLAKYSIMGKCPDPKRLGSELDPHLDYAARAKVQAELDAALKWVHQARVHETNHRTDLALEQYRILFGASFPRYG
jgi:Second Messenger Oligonucleotide or Dinucleotide Synthetase domain